MRSVKTIGSIMTLIFLTAFLVCLSSPVMAETVAIKYSDGSSYGQCRTVAMKEWGDWLEKRTGGRVKMEYYWSGSLAKTRDGIKATKGGIADMCTNPSWGYQKALFPIWQFSELLLLGPADWGAHSKTVKEMHDTTPMLQEELKKTGVKIVGMFGVHPTQFITRKPIRKLEDFKGLRLRAVGPMADWLKSIGASPVGVTIYETYEAIQKGTVDGTATYMYINIPFKFHEVTKYLLATGMQNITINVHMNQNLFDKLPKDIQKIIEDEGWDKMVELQTKAYDDDYAKSKAAVTAKGIEFVEIDDKEMDRWKNTVRKPVYDKWLKKMDKKGIDGQALLDRYTEIYKKHARK